MIGACSSRNNKGLHVIEILKPYGYEALCNIDTFILVICSLGLWLSSVPPIVQSLRMIQDTSSKQLFFHQPSSVLEYTNGSYGVFVSNQDTMSATLVLFYAKWDADSRASRRILESANQFSPLEVFAVECWRNPCSNIVQAKRYPELRVYLKGFGHLVYRGYYDPVHIVKFASRTLRPLIFIGSEAELSMLILIHKLVVVGRFYGKKGTSVGYEGFYKTALRFSVPGFHKKTLATSGIDVSKDLIFAVANFPRDDNITKGSDPTEDVSLTIYSNCASSETTHNLKIGLASSNRVAKMIADTIKPAILNAKCLLHPMDITPNPIERSTAFHSILSAGPVLFLVGPHLSVLKNVDQNLYLLRSLQVAYTSCNNNTSADSQTSNSDRSVFPVGNDAHKLLYRMASESQYRDLRLASVCPLWLHQISSFLDSSPLAICGVSNASPKDTESSTAERRIPLMRAMDRVQLLLKNSSTRETVAHQASAFLRKLSMDESPLDTHARSPDDALSAEHMQLTCCQWLHLNKQFNRNASDQDNIDAPALLLYEAAQNDGVPPPTPADRLACGTNRTLRFHLLDSHVAPILAWELTGFNAQSESIPVGAAIVDQQAEAVYRLEEPVTYQSLSNFVAAYHSSTLKPWRRHPHPSQTTPSSGHSNLISIRDSDHLKELLDARTRIKSAMEVDQVTPKVNSSLVLLYYSRACGFSTQGDSLLWHFESLAQSLAANPAVIFARVDVSAVELPWELRVERIPSVIFFPSSRSSYSSVFPLTANINDLSTSLSQFVRSHLADAPTAEPNSNSPSPHAFSIRAREALLRMLSEITERSTGFTMEHVYKHCDAHNTVDMRALCRSGVRLAINAHKNRVLHAQLTATKLIQRIQDRLNEINTELMSSATKLYAPSSHVDRLSLSLKVHSDMWRAIQSYQMKILATQRFLSSGQLP